MANKCTCKKAGRSRVVSVFLIHTMPCSFVFHLLRPLAVPIPHIGVQAVIELLDGEGAVYMKKKLGRERNINALATVEGNKGGWTLIFYAAAGGQPDVVSIVSNLYALLLTISLCTIQSS